MSRKEVRVSIKMLPSGDMRMVRDPHGNLMAYEDQIQSLHEIVGQCKTRDQAQLAVYDRAKGHDPHHGIHSKVITAHHRK